MSEISFNSIFDGVSLALHQTFPESKIYGGETGQGIQPGDFNVILPGGGSQKEVGQRYRRTPLVDVIYYPKDTDGAECYDVAHQLVQVLESIATPQGDIIHAADLSWEITDRVLHCLVRYDHFVRTYQETEVMETLTIRQEE